MNFQKVSFSSNEMRTATSNVSCEPPNGASSESFIQPGLLRRRFIPSRNDGGTCTVGCIMHGSCKILNPPGLTTS